jgi:periplasmic protein TonB
MRTASFFLISLALHAGALAYPAFFIAPELTRPVVVTVIESDEDGGGSGKSVSPAAKYTAGSGRKLPPQKSSKAAPAPPAARAAEFPMIAPPAELALPVIEQEINGTIAVAARESTAVVAFEGAAAASSDAAAGGSMGGSGSNADGSGLGNRRGAGTGSGGGSGEGSGSGDGGARFLPASYAVCPKADYPEDARREGWEGTVMIEVAVDEQGRPKSSRVQRSSGFAILDRAALDNIQRRCRFHPARRGERRVETSIKIPVVFRLADSKAR